MSSTDKFKVGDKFYYIEMNHISYSLPRVMESQVERLYSGMSRKDINGGDMLMINGIFPVRLCGRTPLMAYNLFIDELKNYRDWEAEGDRPPFY